MTTRFSTGAEKLRQYMADDANRLEFLGNPGDWWIVIAAMPVAGVAAVGVELAQFETGGDGPTAVLVQQLQLVPTVASLLAMLLPVAFYVDAAHLESRGVDVALVPWQAAGLGALVSVARLIALLVESRAAPSADVVLAVAGVAVCVPYLAWRHRRLSQGE